MSTPLCDQMTTRHPNGEVVARRCDDTGEAIAYLEDVARDLRLAHKLGSKAGSRAAVRP